MGGTCKLNPCHSHSSDPQQAGPGMGTPGPGLLPSVPAHPAWPRPSASRRRAFPDCLDMTAMNISFQKLPFSLA